MKKSLFLLCLIGSFFLFSGCSDDDVRNPVVGNWVLKSWSIQIPVDLNGDGVYSTNLLKETRCAVREILSFDTNGIVASTHTFNPELQIALKEDTSDEYFVDEICAEGILGFAAEYDQIGEESISYNDNIGTVRVNRLSLVFKNAIKIYNADFTKVIETKDLFVIYQKV
ncbi:hypothetical protein ES711_01870 [Gelidibacter salicanalis]|uniref:Lipocalin-like domain-containing protein n=1 Tax=Gelidibacter salicanalis TaxID=291193 RepID=A0A5C7ASS3_9FLAO|nr:hypothetical protein [Gelidibacter salicanalis]TXE10679.1 hypothetical protein ES711_01870 [Gelidibacter salicanalis]